MYVRPSRGYWVNLDCDLSMYESQNFRIDSISLLNLWVLETHQLGMDYDGAHILAVL